MATTINPNRPERTMGESEKKGELIFHAIISLVAFIVFAMTFFNLFNTNLYDWHKNGGWFSHLIAIGLFLFGAIWPWVADKIAPASMARLGTIAGFCLPAIFLIPVVASGFKMPL